MPQPSSLPVFKDGILLSARDLNRISENEDYLYVLTTRQVNMPFRAMGTDDPRWLAHRHRYLYWNVAQPADAYLEINGRQGPSAKTVTSQWVDLHPDGGNPYGLVMGKPYALLWVGDPLICHHLHEMPTTGSLALPDPVPTFADGQVLTAASLNNLTNNLRFLRDHRLNKPVRAFLQETLPVQAPVYRYYHFIHVHPNLYVRIQAERHSAEESYDLRLEIDSGGSWFEFFRGDYDMSDTTGDRLFEFAVALDPGAVTINYTGFGTITPPPSPSFGQTFTVRLYTVAGNQNAQIRTRVQIVAETPDGGFF